MYKNFFGFKERPFKLVPNPAYLFLSRSHEEAMAHLTYAMKQGDGFVEITGEVGTGKTTICRAFLESLDENTEAAYIFNPKLDSIQLIKAVNDEFGISSDADNIKDLIDTLNSFLIEKRAEGKNVILLIDEAQGLNKEVLEQLRLLSNLETTNHKLLQIILVGQPELGEKLDSSDLRQLSQRISLSCRLIPLNYRETKEYIQHRINIASQKPGVKFTRAAYRYIYKYSRGIPRSINIVCGRALLTAFGLDQQRISGKIIRTSIKELAGRGDMKRYGLWDGKKAILLFSVLCLSLFMILFYRPGFLNVNEIFNLQENKKPDISQPEHLVLNPAPDLKPTRRQAVKDLGYFVEPVRDLGVFLGEKNKRSSRPMALKVALDLWNTEYEIKPYLNGIDNDLDFFRLVAKQNGLLIRRIKGDLNLVKKLNLPAVLPLYLPEDLSPVYLTLIKIEGEKVTLRSEVGDNAIKVEQNILASYWSGVAYIPWKNFLSLTGTIPLNSSKDTIITLKILMHDIGFNNIEINPFYDESTKHAVKEIQKKHGIQVDGVVGSTTKIVLYNEKNDFKIPHIMN
jgi:general secretion pathway protein A